MLTETVPLPCDKRHDDGNGGGQRAELRGQG
jgi:hypothetical protein